MPKPAVTWVDCLEKILASNLTFRICRVSRLVLEDFKLALKLFHRQPASISKVADIAKSKKAEFPDGLVDL